MKNRLFVLLTTVSFLFIPSTTYATQKSETVYTTLNSDGSVYKSTVSNHLSHLTKEEIEDQSELEDIMNIGGSGRLTQLGSNLTWNTTSSELFYRGSTTKEMPIAVEIEYFLDGKKTSLEEALGKSGHIRIEYRFRNKDKKAVNVRGEYVAVYTPYLTTLGTILDSNSKNITVENGKTISNGSKNFVLGYASPGLYDSTHIKELSTLDMIALEYETESFSLPTTYIVSTPKFIEKDILSIFDKIGSLSTSIDELTKNMTTIDEGMNALDDGLSSLVGGSKDLKNSLAYATSTMTLLKDGSIDLDRGIDLMIKEISNVKNTLSDSSNPDVQRIGQLRAKNHLAIEKLQTAILNNGIQPEELLTACQDPTATNPLLQNDTVAMFCLLSANDQTVEKMNSTLSSNIDTILNALAEIKKGSSTLSEGLTKMDSGMALLTQGANSIYAGSNKLKTGSSELAVGTHTFKTQGIDKLSNTAKTFADFGNKFEALAKLSIEYRGFTSDNSNETVFISMVKPQK